MLLILPVLGTWTVTVMVLNPVRWRSEATHPSSSLDWSLHCLEHKASHLEMQAVYRDAHRRRANCSA